MRSIRRSLTVYLLILVGAALGVAGVVIDRVGAQTLAAREAAGADLIQARYEDRCREEQDHTAKALLDQAKELGSVMQAYYYTQYAAELDKSRAAIGAVQLAFGPVPFSPAPLAQAGWTAFGNSTGTFAKPNPHPWALFRTYFANPPLPDEFIQHVYEEKGGTDFLQINTPSGRAWRSPSLAGRALPFDPKVDARSPESRPDDPGKAGEAANLIDWVIGHATLTGGEERVRRVLLTIPHFGRTPPLMGFRPPPPRQPGRDDRPPGGGGSPGGGTFGGQPGGGFGNPRPIAGAWGLWPGGGTPGRSLVGAWAAGPGAQPGWSPTPPPTVESLPRLYIQCARPQAAIDAALAGFGVEREEELGRLAAEIGEARATLRFRIVAVGLVAFLAVAVGGPLLIGAGLRPVGKLSDAVSRVSAKDFKLPHDGTDLTAELAPIHAGLTQTLDLLQRAFAREKQSVADISHELRTPIASLLATIDVALRKPRTPEQYRITLEECRLISKQLSQLVERIMTLASLDAGNDRTLLARTDAADLASGCAAVARPLAAANGLALDVRIDDALELETDPGKLREVLMNLLHNAVEYNKPGGEIELSVRRENGAAVFEVRDTGIGMTPEVREKIFERFFRADVSRHATGVHAGLGLAIVKEYVDRLGGAIDVESEPGVGSTFRVTLPTPDRDAGAARTAGVPVGAGS